MKVTVVPSRRNTKEFTVEIEQGHQYFRLDYSGQKSEARFMAKMFRLALTRHMEEAKAETKPVTRKRRKATVAIDNVIQGPAA